MRLADFNIVHGEIVRSYFYDAKFIDGDDRRKVQEEYFDHIRQSDYCEVRLGRLIDAPEGPRQKGVDVLMAIDMLGKAYENHYDIAVVLAGGDDFEPLELRYFLTFSSREVLAERIRDMFQLRRFLEMRSICH